MPDTSAFTEPMPLVSESDLINPLMKVSDAMTRSPRSCSPASSLVEAALIMRDANAGVVPVTEAGRPVGVLTDRDIALALPEHQALLASLPVSALMSRQLVTVRHDAPLASAMDRLGDQGVRRVLVLDDNGLLVGVLSCTDLVPHLSERGIGRVVARIVENR